MFIHVNCLSDYIKFLLHNSQLCSFDLLGVLSLLSGFPGQTQIKYTYRQHKLTHITGDSQATKVFHKTYILNVLLETNPVNNFIVNHNTYINIHIYKSHSSILAQFKIIGGTQHAHLVYNRKHTLGARFGNKFLELEGIEFWKLKF